MRNEFPTHCVRCAEPLRSSTMSRFNTDTICLACDADERLAPGYTAAAAAELEAVRRGDRNFPGVGLSNADRLFFANRLAERRKVRPGLAGDWDDFSKSNDRLGPSCAKCGRGYYDLVHWPQDCHEFEETKP